MRSGRFLAAGDRGVAVLGSDFAASRKLTVGEPLPVGALEFAVVGILDKTLTAPDRFAIVPLEDARDLWLRRDPLLCPGVRAGRPHARRPQLGRGGGLAGRAWIPTPSRGASRPPSPASTSPSPASCPASSAPSTAFFSALLIGIGTAGPRDRRPLALEHGDRRGLRAHPRLRHQARPRRHRRAAPARGRSARRSA